MPETAEIVAFTTTIEQGWGTGHEVTYTTKDIDNAFNKGVKHQKQVTRKLVEDLLTHNAVKAQQASVGFFDYINGLKSFTCSKIRLRIQPLTLFNALFIVPLEDYTSKRFLSVIKRANKVEQELESDDFIYTIGFIPDSPNLNEDRLIADGYVLNFGGNGKST